MSNVVVLFEVNPTKEGMKRYLDLATMLKPLLAGFEGFIRAERFSNLNEEGKLLSMCNIQQHFLRQIYTCLPLEI